MAEAEATGTDAPAGASSDTEESFAGRMFQLVADGHLCLSVAMGAHTGLFEAMSEMEVPQSAADIARATNYKERYVREWLGAMVTGKIIDLSTDSGEDKFFFPPHRHRGLTKKGETDSSADYSLSVPALAEVFGKIGECFKKDGPKGVPYSAYSNILWSSLDGMTEDRYKKYLITDIVPSVPGMTDSLSKYYRHHASLDGMTADMYKKYLLSDIVPSVPGMTDSLTKGASILEIGCGTGATSLRIAAAYPNSNVLATDYSEEALEILTTKAIDLDLSNITIANQDATALPSDWTGKFDYVFANDMVHDTAKPAEVLSGCYNVLKPNGSLIMIDVNVHTSLAQNIDDPCAPMVYNFSLMNCMPVSLHYDGAGLGAAWGVEKAREMLEEAGFNDIRLKSCPTDFDAMFVCKKT